MDMGAILVVLTDERTEPKKIGSGVLMFHHVYGGAEKLCIGPSVTLSGPDLVEADVIWGVTCFAGSRDLHKNTGEGTPTALLIEKVLHESYVNGKAQSVFPSTTPRGSDEMKHVRGAVEAFLFAIPLRHFAMANPTREAQAMGINSNEMIGIRRSFSGALGAYTRPAEVDVLSNRTRHRAPIG